MRSRTKVLVACEFSGTVREAFIAQGFDAWSCDLLPDERGSNRHITGDVRGVLNDGWDMLMVAHPPCTRLCSSGVRWLTVPPPGRTLAELWAELDEGADLFSLLWNADIPHIAVENPVMHSHAKERIVNYREFTQSVQPWNFGQFETKRTCLWLKNLPALVKDFATIDECRKALDLPWNKEPEAKVHNASPGVDRAKERSRFFPGVAKAMAVQWGNYIVPQLRAA